MLNDLDKAPLSSFVDVNPRTSVAGEWVPFVGMEDVSEDGRLVRVRERNRAELTTGLAAFQDGDVILAKITPCMENGKGAYVHGLNGQSALGSTEFHVLRPRRGVSSRFVYQWTRSRHFRLAAEAMMTGSAGQRRVPSEFFGRYLIPVFPLEEQRRIAETLDGADEVIRSEELIASKFQRMKQGFLGDLRGITGCTRDCATVREVATKVTDGDHHTPRKAEAGIPLLGAGNVQDGYLDFGDVDFVDEDEYRRMIKRCWPEEGDVLISCSGSIGRVARVPAGVRIALVRSVALVKVDKRVCMPEYLEMALRLPGVQRQIRNAQKQAAQPNLFQAPIEQLVIPLPALADQASIVNRALNYECSVDVHRFEARKLRLLKLGLMDDLLTGRVRVRVTDGGMEPVGTG